MRGRSTESNTMRDVMIGGFVVSFLILLASEAGESAQRQEANTQVPALQQMITETLIGSSTVCLDNYPQSPFPFFFPSFQDTFIQSIKNSEGELLSPDSKIREHAKQLLAWQLVTPNGNPAIYDNFIKRIAPINPKDKKDANSRFFLDTLDAVTNFTPSNFTDPKRPAEALCEATFRTLNLMNNPKGNDWKKDTLTFKSTKYLPINTFPMFTQGRFGRLQVSKGGDTNSGVNTETNEWKINVAQH